MPAYVIVDIRVTDPETFTEDLKLTPPVLAKYGEHFIVRAGRSEVLEGEWTPDRTVVLEFESLERAKEWWVSDEYAGPKAARQRSAETTMIGSEGVEP